MRTLPSEPSAFRAVKTQTFARRAREAQESAELIGASYECLTQLDGSHVPMQVFADRNVLGGLWNALRAFGPDVVFYPPVVADPLSGVHVDHIHTAHAVRLVVCEIQAPNAYPVITPPREQRMSPPLIINVDDSYAGETAFDVRQDISEVYDIKERMAMCHASQIYEWLPFTRGREVPITPDEFRKEFHERHWSLNRQFGFDDRIPSEYLRVTRWGRAPREGELDTLFPRAIRTDRRRA